MTSCTVVPAVGHARSYESSDISSMRLFAISATQGVAHVLLEQYQEAEAALLEGPGLEPRHEGMVATMATVAAALEPEPASPTSPAVSTPKRSAPLLSDTPSGMYMPVLLSGSSRAHEEAYAHAT